MGDLLLQALQLTAFHVAVSVGCAVALVEWLHPSHRDLPWAGRPGLGLAGTDPAALAALTLLAPDAFFPVEWTHAGAVAWLAAGLVVAAPRLPRRWPGLVWVNGLQSVARPAGEVPR